MSSSTVGSVSQTDHLVLLVLERIREWSVGSFVAELIVGLTMAVVHSSYQIPKLTEVLSPDSDTSVRTEPASCHRQGRPAVRKCLIRAGRNTKRSIGHFVIEMKRRFSRDFTSLAGPVTP